MKKILIIEDDKFLSDLYQEVLKQEGYAITLAVDGEEGFSKMKTDKI